MDSLRLLSLREMAPDDVSRSETLIQNVDTTAECSRVG